MDAVIIFIIKNLKFKSWKWRKKLLVKRVSSSKYYKRWESELVDHLVISIEFVKIKRSLEA